MDSMFTALIELLKTPLRHDRGVDVGLPRIDDLDPPRGQVRQPPLLHCRHEREVGHGRGLTRAPNCHDECANLCPR